MPDYKLKVLEPVTYAGSHRNGEEYDFPYKPTREDRLMTHALWLLRGPLEIEDWIPSL
ncbi:MAG: hypothetical protein HYW23_01690 [Candidatus Aenigmarchaeota archaeon]|nr:hypothetical protein [Candidatus Aenigmarchaeota archaeon]